MDEIIEPIPLRYDGMDAENHEIELASLGESLQGASRIISVVSNFVVTGEYKFNYQSHDIRVVTKEPTAKCFELLLFIKAVSQHPMFGGFAGSLVAAIVAYVIAKKSKEPTEAEKRLLHIEEKLIEHGTQDRKILIGMLSVIEKMADDLHPSLKQTVAPIEVTCETIQIGRTEYEPLVITPDRKKKIIEEGEITIDDERDYSVYITELDKENATCKVRFSQSGEEKRIPAIVADPTIKVTNDPYTLAMASRSEVQVTGKLEYQDEELKRLHILKIRS
jgi:hypothetical protein